MSDHVGVMLLQQKKWIGIHLWVKVTATSCLSMTSCTPWDPYYFSTCMMLHLNVELCWCNQGMANKHIYAYKHICKIIPKKYMLKENVSGGSICLEAFARKRIKRHNMLISIWELRPICFFWKTNWQGLRRCRATRRWSAVVEELLLEDSWKVCGNDMQVIAKVLVLFAWFLMFSTRTALNWACNAFRQLNCYKIKASPLAVQR
jgi:hypothetical protein